MSDCSAEIGWQVSELPGAQRKPPSARVSSQGPVRGVLHEYQRVSNVPGRDHHPAVTPNAQR